MTNYEKAIAIYETSGQHGIYSAVSSGELFADSWRHCAPCEDKTPFEKKTCLVCGTENA